MSIEDELIKASKFKPQREYTERQDYLAALARAVNSLSQKEFDLLTNPAADWFNAAAQSLNDGTDLPDFGDAPEKSPTQGQEAPLPEEKPKEKKKRPRAPENLPHTPFRQLKSSDEIEFDRFGIAIGTKNASAISMLVEGCRMSDITTSIGGTYYNILRKLVKEGHKLEKYGDGSIKIIHKDDVGKQEK